MHAIAKVRNLGNNRSGCGDTLGSNHASHHANPTRERVAVRDTLQSETRGATAIQASDEEVVAHPHVSAKDPLHIESMEGLSQPLTRPSFVS